MRLGSDGPSRPLTAARTLMLPTSVDPYDDDTPWAKKMAEGQRGPKWARTGRGWNASTDRGHKRSSDGLQTRYNEPPGGPSRVDELLGGET